MSKKTTKEKALEEGRSLLQQCGYNGFSFQDIAEKLDIKKPSLYGHFASKEELIIDIVRDYSLKFDLWTQAIVDLSPLEKVRRVFDVFFSFASDKGKVCPILALSLDFQGVGKEIRNEINLFVDKWLGWLERQLREGQSLGLIRDDMDPQWLATFIYSQAMGSQFQARIKKNPSLTLISGEQILALIKNSRGLK